MDRKEEPELPKTIAKLEEEIASQKRLIAALQEALGELLGHCSNCDGYLDIVGWNGELMMRKCSNHACSQSLRPLPGLQIWKVQQMEQLLGRPLKAPKKEG